MANYYATLGSDLVNCGNDAAVTKIAFQYPGGILGTNNKDIMSNLPAKFTGNDALTGSKLALSPGTDVKNIVSFK